MNRGAESGFEMAPAGEVLAAYRCLGFDFDPDDPAVGGFEEGVDLYLSLVR